MQTSYNSMDVQSLRKLCASRKIKYCYIMSKTKMIEMLEKNDKDPTFVLDEDTKRLSSKYHLKWIKNNREKYLGYHKKYYAIRKNKLPLVT